ncbi:NAD(P)-binding protein [Hysterangium stoloniferum]|nr:NAD(P)-binding protein [Hysterangium stoloniferum]
MLARHFIRPARLRHLQPGTLFIQRRTFQDAKIQRSRMLPEFSLQGKVCVVTGAARGLGNVFCRAFLESGCTSIALIDLVKEDADAAAAELVASFVNNGQAEEGEIQAMGVECDVASEVSVKSAMADIIDKFGKIDSLVTSAGICENYTALEYPHERIKKLYDINVHGAFFCAREAARDMMKRQNGSIILIASMSANIVNVPQFQMPYNASKAAVKHMAASLGVEWAKQGVRVNALSPGYMLTKLTRQVMSANEELKNTWEKLTPMGRMGDPDELKGAIVFLASDASRFVTATEITVDGGYCAV